MNLNINTLKNEIINHKLELQKKVIVLIRTKEKYF